MKSRKLIYSLMALFVCAGLAVGLTYSLKSPGPAAAAEQEAGVDILDLVRHHRAELLSNPEKYGVEIICQGTETRSGGVGFADGTGFYCPPITCPVYVLRVPGIEPLIAVAGPCPELEEFRAQVKAYLETHRSPPEVSNPQEAETFSPLSGWEM